MFHPLWSFTWADQEELLYLQTIQGQIPVLREAAKQGSWQTPDQQLTAHYKSYRPPIAAWRFYVALPLLDDLSGIIGSAASPATYPGPVFSNAWSTTMKNLTLHQLVIAQEKGSRAGVTATGEISPSPQSRRHQSFHRS